MFCSKCGHQNNDGATVCAKCGNSIAQNVNQPAQTKHAVPKCTCCGYEGEMKPGPLFRQNDIIWIVLLLCMGGIGIFYILYILITRGNADKREKICPNCKSQNMYTYVY